MLLGSHGLVSVLGINKVSLCLLGGGGEPATERGVIWLQNRSDPPAVALVKVL